MSAFGRWVLLLVAALPLSAHAARDADAEAQRLLGRAHALAARARGASEVDARMAQDVREATRTILKLQAETEHGFVKLGPANSRALELALDALESLPAQKSSGPKALSSVTLSGVVTDAGTALPITSGVTIQATNFTALTTTSTAVGAGGAWSITLPAGSYQLRTTNSAGYVNQAYNGLTCFDTLLCPRYAGNIVTVADGGSASGLNFALNKGGTITGTVRRASDAATLSGAFVLAVGESGFGTATASTDGAGNYTIKGLPTGRYRVFVDADAMAAATLGLLDGLYGGQACADDDCFWVVPTWVNVTAGANTGGIDIALAATSKLSGQITTNGSTPIAGAFVTLLSEDGATYRVADPAPGDPNGASTDAAGNYSFGQVRPGTSRVIAQASGRLGRAYPAVDCVDFNTCDIMAIGGVVSVPPGGNVTGLNLTLPAGATVSGTITRATD